MILCFDSKDYLDERPNETVEKPLVRKMFIKISHNRLKNCPNVAKMLCGTPKTRHLSAFLSHFSKIIFEERLFRQLQRYALASPPLMCLLVVSTGQPSGAGRDNVILMKPAWAEKTVQKRAPRGGQSNRSGAHWVRPLLLFIALGVQSFILYTSAVALAIARSAWSARGG